MNIGGEHVSARSDAPRNHRLVDPSALQSLADAILLNAANLSKENQHLDLGIILKGNLKIQVSLICLSYYLCCLWRYRQARYRFQKEVNSHLISEQVIHERCSRVTIAADGYALVDAICVSGDDVV